MQRACVAVVAGSLFLVAAGCSTDGPEIVPVRGKVTRNGKAVPNLFIDFQPDNGRNSWAVTDDEGNFELEYDQSTKGARLGEHTVTASMRPKNIEDEMKMRAGKLKLHPDVQKIVAKYGAGSADRKKVTVSADTETVDLELD